jgi:hypothetical protein
MNARCVGKNRREKYSAEGNLPTVYRPNQSTDMYDNVGMAEHSYRGPMIWRKMI